MATHFKIGDEIIMNDLANIAYGITKKGSIGVIEKVNLTKTLNDDCYYVKFSKITRTGHPLSSYWVSAKCFELHKQLTIQEKVINKIKLMDQQRKEKGYAF